MRPVPLGTMFFLITHGATAPAAHRPLAALLGITDPTDPTSVRVHARTVAELLIQPATSRPTEGPVIIGPPSESHRLAHPGWSRRSRGPHPRRTHTR
jgi:hypothetical protein